MELKGVSVNKIKQDKKEKMQSTLARMNKVRSDDNVYLRDLLEAKKKNLYLEQSKAQEQVERLEKLLLRLRGAILIIEEVLNQTKPKEQHD